MGQEWSRKTSGDCPERVYTLEETLLYTRALLKLDKEFCQYIHQCVYGYLAFRMAELGKPDDVREAVKDPEFVRLSGSCADGGGICRWFRHGRPDVELDITYQVGVVSSENEACILANIPEKPGFLKIYNTRETYECLHPLIHLHDLSIQFFQAQGVREFVNTMNMLADVSGLFSLTNDSSSISEIEHISSLLMDVDESALNLHSKDKVEGPSHMMDFIFTLQNENVIACSWDSVLALRLENIPHEIKPCLERLEHILPPSVMAELRRAQTLLVAKRSPGSTTEEEWRHSTSEMEKILMRTWREPGNDMKMVCYFTLKCLLYRYIRGIEVCDKYIPSYALKTEMFWMVESMDPSEWTDTNFLKNLRKILNSFMVDVKSRKIRNYFIPEMNIIDPSVYPLELTEAVSMKLKEMIDNLEAFLPHDLERMIKQGEVFLTALKAIIAYISYKKVNADLDKGRVSGLGEALQLLDIAGVDMAGLVQGFLSMNTKK